MRNEGITRGCAPPQSVSFCPNDPVTREQMAAFMYRFAQTLQGTPTPPTSPPPTSATSTLPPLPPANQEPTSAITADLHEDSWATPQAEASTGDVVGLSSASVSVDDGSYVQLSANLSVMAVSSNATSPMSQPVVSTFAWIEAGASCSDMAYAEEGWPIWPAAMVPVSAFPTYQGLYSPLGYGAIVTATTVPEGVSQVFSLCATVQPGFGGEFAVFGDSALVATQSPAGSVTSSG